MKRNGMWFVGAGVVVVMLLGSLLAGCSDIGLRFRPGEQQAQSAQMADDLAKASLVGGIPPGSAAADTLAKATGPARSFAGEPRNPVDVAPAAREAARQWSAMEGQVDAYKTRYAVRDATAMATQNVLADLAKDMAGKKNIRPAEVVPMVKAMATMEQVGQKIATAIEVPEIAPLTPIEKERLESLKTMTATITEAANTLAAARPDVKDVADRVNVAFEETVDWVGENPLLSALLGATPIGATVLALRSSRRRKEQAASDADWDEEYAAAKEEATKRAQELELAKAQAAQASAQAQAAAQTQMQTMMATLLTAMSGKSQVTAG